MEKVTVLELFDNFATRDYMLDEDLHLLDNLGDCQNTKLDEIDIITRTTKNCHLFKKRLVSRSSQRSSKSNEPPPVLEENSSQEEETELLPFGLAEEEVPSDEETKTRNAILDLDQILKRIDILQCQIRRRQQMEITTEGTQQDEDHLSCDGLNPKQSEIRCIKRAQHYIQCQITELLCRYDVLKNILRKLSHQWSCLERQIANMRSLNLDHLEWTEVAANDLSNCQNRHRSMDAVKLTKKMALLVTKTNMSCGFRYSRRYLRQALIRLHINDFHYELIELKLLSEQICSEIDQRLHKIKLKAQNMGLVFPQTPRQSTLVGADVAAPFTLAREQP
ncbi:uncharacterized protein LOC108110287 [Drosophila eugracilis]|uniref:uncharacterized protein LOC108110287 n=1 Tax=Drosophila eugracilis TaxID=29029 RepID=UPI0007E62881|nr:uncharacterized protein LOC108110287 [Drosophila eugracilis]